MQRVYLLFLALCFTVTCFTFLPASQKQRPKEQKMTVKRLEAHLKENLYFDDKITHAIKKKIKVLRKENPKNIQEAYDLYLMLIRDHVLVSVNTETCERLLHEEKKQSFSFKSLLLCCNTCL